MVSSPLPTLKLNSSHFIHINNWKIDLLIVDVCHEVKTSTLIALLKLIPGARRTISINWLPSKVGCLAQCSPDKETSRGSGDCWLEARGQAACPRVLVSSVRYSGQCAGHSRHRHLLPPALLATCESSVIQISDLSYRLCFGGRNY